MLIVRSSEERCPLDFRGYDCVVSDKRLLAGDYSLFGFEREVAALRRSPQELVAGLTHQRDSFADELDILRGYRAAVLVVEMPLRDLLDSRLLGGLTRDQAEQAIAAITAKFRMPFQFATGREDAQRQIYNFLRHFQGYAIVRYNSLVKSVQASPEKMLDETGRQMLRQERDKELAEEAKKKAEQLQRNAEAQERAQGIAQGSEEPVPAPPSHAPDGAKVDAQAVVDRMIGRK